MIVQNELQSKTWRVDYLRRPSTRMLRVRFEQEADSATPLPTHTPVRLEVVYALGVRDLHRSTGTANLYHLAAPSAASVLAMCSDVLTRRDVVQPGQLVVALATKVIKESGANCLYVAIAPIDTASKPVNEPLDFKLLKWFIAKCALEGREPSREAFKILYKNLKRKSKSNGT